MWKVPRVLPCIGIVSRAKVRDAITARRLYRALWIISIVIVFRYVRYLGFQVPPPPPPSPFSSSPFLCALLYFHCVCNIRDACARVVLSIRKVWLSSCACIWTLHSQKQQKCCEVRLNIYLQTRKLIQCLNIILSAEKYIIKMLVSLTWRTCVRYP